MIFGLLSISLSISISLSLSLYIYVCVGKNLGDTGYMADH